MDQSHTNLVGRLKTKVVKSSVFTMKNTQNRKMENMMSKTLKVGEGVKM